MAERYEITVEDVDIPAMPRGGPAESEITGSRGLTGVLAVPVSSDGRAISWPAVVIVHEAFGVTDVMRRQVERLAMAGYVVLMPDLFSEGGARKCLRSTFRALMTGEGRAFADIERARGWLASRDETTSRIGVLGFCMGGGFALMTANRGFDASSVNYGRLPREIDEQLIGACPIVASYGGRDLSLKNAARTLEDALSRAKLAHDVKEYPTAGHSFLNDADDGPSWLRPIFGRVLGAGPDPVAAQDAWQRIESFFAEHLGSPVMSS